MELVRLSYFDKFSPVLNEADAKRNLEDALIASLINMLYEQKNANNSSNLSTDFIAQTLQAKQKIYSFETNVLGGDFNASLKDMLGVIKGIKEFGFNKDDFEDMIKKLKDKENNKPVSKTEEPKEIVKPIEKPAEIPAKKTETKVDAPVKKVEKVAATDKKSEAKPAKAENKVDKKIEKKVETKIEKTDKKAEVAKTEPATKGSYVQVFVTSKFNPNAEYMKKIAAKGYSYKTIKVGELTKILVGPFDEKTLQKAVGDIRKDINKDAFIFRAK